ncbi:unnamed protein product [Triticum turgidum subsp. durum]|uniref:Uncharacterized protein n=1 Tax=Triticum turgidum subsp. durum TaxID=4567 RepID=A0A9R1PIV8_TRITD|nr:unnamed protein product [Triticum turgidum subsp. durum]
MADAPHEPREATDSSTPEAADDFEFRVLSTGGLVSAGAAAADDMCVADELFSHGKLLPLRPSSTASADAPTVVLLPRSESVASTAGFGSRSDCRSASSSGSSSGCVSRSHSSKSASSDHAAAPPRRSLSSSLFYAHPSPSPQLRSRPRRKAAAAGALGSSRPPAPLRGASGNMARGCSVTASDASARRTSSSPSSCLRHRGKADSRMGTSREAAAGVASGSWTGSKSCPSPRRGSNLV